MTSGTINVSETRLIELAGQAASQMKKAVEGKEAGAVAQSSAGSLSAVAAMIDALAADIVERRDECRRLTAALERIAGLKVRSATRLLERSDWKKIAGELQAIAEEAVAGHAGRR